MTTVFRDMFKVPWEIRHFKFNLFAYINQNWLMQFRREKKVDENQ